MVFPVCYYNSNCQEYCLYNIKFNPISRIVNDYSSFNEQFETFINMKHFPSVLMGNISDHFKKFKSTSTVA